MVLSFDKNLIHRTHTEILINKKKNLNIENLLKQLLVIVLLCASGYSVMCIHSGLSTVVNVPTLDFI